MADCKRTTIVPMVPFRIANASLLANITVIEEPGKTVHVEIWTPGGDLTLMLERPVADAIADALRSHSDV